MLICSYTNKLTVHRDFMYENFDGDVDYSQHVCRLESTVLSAAV